MPLSARDRRTLTIGAIVAGVLLAGVLVMSLLGGGEETLPPPTGGGTGTGSQTPTPTLTPSPGPSLIPVFAGRDPFSIPGVFGTTTTTSSSGTGSQTSSTSTSGTTTSSTTSPPTQPGGGSSVTIDGHTVVLLDVSSPGGVPTIQVEVDGTVSTVQRGDTFGPGNRFEFVSSSGSCATIRAGETSYVLCVNPQK